MPVQVRKIGLPGDLGWVVMAHGQLYAQEFGWDTDFEALVARIVSDFAESHDEAREAGWIAELDSQRVGCVFCVAENDDTALLRILLVAPVARGRGVGRLLVEECIEFARAAGYARMQLWTNEPLRAAGHLYRRLGFILVGEEPHHSFGKDLIGQTYELDLNSTAAQLGGHGGRKVDTEEVLPRDL